MYHMLLVGGVITRGQGDGTSKKDPSVFDARVAEGPMIVTAALQRSF